MVAPCPFSPFLETAPASAAALASRHDTGIDHRGTQEPVAISGSDNAIISTNTSPLPGVIVVDEGPRLAPLADHAGPTSTHALLADSPAIDLGNNSQSSGYDQRGPGFDRIAQDAADIGACERRTSDDEMFADGFD